MTRGHNVFEDLVEDCENLAATLRLAGNRPLDEIRHALLSTHIDELLDTLGKVTNARPAVGQQFDIESAPTVPLRDRTEKVRVAMDEENIQYGLEQQGFFDQFNPLARERVREALQSVDGAEFNIIHDEGTTWAPSGLVDLFAKVAQIAVTGNTETPWEMG